MPKTTSKTMSKEEQTANLNKVLVAVIVLLFACLTLVSYKYAMIRGAWRNYVVKSWHETDTKKEMNSVEDATVVAMTIGRYPASKPIYTQAEELQNFITAFSKQTHRDLVVLDLNKMILGDTIPANIGKKYEADRDGEVMKTIGDGQLRSFTETSVDYPTGLAQTVVPLKDPAGNTVGAVILSTSPIFN